MPLAAAARGSDAGPYSDSSFCEAALGAHHQFDTLAAARSEAVQYLAYAATQSQELCEFIVAHIGERLPLTVESSGDFLASDASLPHAGPSSGNGPLVNMGTLKFDECGSGTLSQSGEPGEEKMRLSFQEHKLSVDLVQEEEHAACMDGLHRKLNNLSFVATLLAALQAERAGGPLADPAMESLVGTAPAMGVSIPLHRREGTADAELPGVDESIHAVALPTSEPSSGQAAHDPGSVAISVYEQQQRTGFADSTYLEANPQEGQSGDEGERLHSWDGTLKDAAAAHAEEVVTLVLRSIPSRCTRSLLIQDIEQRGFKGTIDFLYLPRDFSSHVCRGYSILNFRSAELARSFAATYHGLSVARGILGAQERVVLGVGVAELQGFQQNVRVFLTRRRVRTHDPQNLPVVFPERGNVGTPLNAKRLPAWLRRLLDGGVSPRAPGA